MKLKGKGPDESINISDIVAQHSTEKREGRTGKELNQETLMIDGKQFRRMSEGVEQKPKYEFSEFYKRFKR